MTDDIKLPPMSRPGYAGVTVWVGDRKCTMVVPQLELETARCDVLLEYFQKARSAIDDAMREEGGQ